MARADFNPLDFGSILPEELSAPDADLSQYLPQELPPERTARHTQLEKLNQLVFLLKLSEQKVFQ